MDVWVEAVHVLTEFVQLLLPMWLYDKSVINLAVPQVWLEWGWSDGFFQVLSEHISHNEWEWETHGCPIDLFIVLVL